MRRLNPGRSAWMRELIHAMVRTSREQRYLHRLHCVLLVAEGRSCYEVARWFGEAPRTIERWVHAFDARGMEGLREHHGGGRPARLTAEQARRLALELRHAPRAALPDASGGWTGPLLNRYLQGSYGIRLSARQCQRLLRLARAPGRGEAGLVVAGTLAAQVLSGA